MADLCLADALVLLLLQLFRYSGQTYLYACNVLGVMLFLDKCCWFIYRRKHISAWYVVLFISLKQVHKFLAIARAKLLRTYQFD